MAALWAVNAIACAPVAHSGPERVDPGWRAYLGTSRHDASARESLPVLPRTVWRTKVGRAVPASPAIGPGVIAVGTSDRAVALLHRASGRLIWRRRVPGSVAGGPLLAGGLLYAATQAVPDGRVLALQLRTGRRAWQARTGSVTAPLALTEALVIAATDAGAVVALDAASGAERWRRMLPMGVRAAPVTTPHGVAVATIADTLFLLDVATGAIEARRATPGTVLGTPVSAERRLYLATTNGRVLAVSLPSLDVAWERGVDGAVYGAPALVGDTLYVVSVFGTLWRIPVGAPAQARALSLTLTTTAGVTPLADAVLVAGLSGEVLCVDAASDSVRWRLRRPGPLAEPPLVRDRQLVLVTGEGAVEVLR